MEAINCIHKQGISHRDIKPENFIFEDNDSDNLKIIDFGLSSSIFIPRNDQPKQQGKDFLNMKTIVGTVWYMAPEIYSKQYTEKCDIWSAGVMLYIMLCGYPPFFGENKNEIKKMVLEGNLEFEDEGWKEISNDVKDLISKMLSKEDSRPSAVECLEHKWFSNATMSTVEISQRTLGRIKSFSHVVHLKKAILMFIAYRSNNREEIQK